MITIVEMGQIGNLIWMVHEIGQAIDVPAPAIDSLLGLSRLHARASELHQAQVPTMRGSRRIEQRESV